MPSAAIRRQGSAARLRFAIGDRVTIVRGALAGLVGKVLDTVDENRWRLSIDSLGPGLSIIACRDALERHRPQWDQPETQT